MMASANQEWNFFPQSASVYMVEVHSEKKQVTKHDGL